MSSFEFTGKCWKQGIPVIDNDGNESVEWQVVPITSVPLECLLVEYEDMVCELGDKQVELATVKELYNGKGFDIVFRSDIDFKSLYGSTSEKVRRQHAKDELSELYDKKESLELSVEWIKNYIPLIREVIQSKRG